MSYRAVLIALTVIVGVTLAVPVSSSAVPASAAALPATGSTAPVCDIDGGPNPQSDSCVISASPGKLVMRFTANLANPVCSGGTTTSCVASVSVDALATSYGDLSGVTIACPFGTYKAKSNYTTEGVESPALTPDTTSMTCTNTWTWNPDDATPTQFSGTVAESDGTGTASPGNSYHSFQVTLPVPPLSPSFTIEPVAGTTPRQFTFVDTSTAWPGATVDSWSWFWAKDSDVQGMGGAKDQTYTFPSDGTYAITLHVGDSASQSATTTQDVDVITPSGSPPSITVIESLHPHADPGLFTLKVDGKAVKAKATDGSYGEKNASIGSHTVSQTISKGALTDYSVSLECLANGKKLLSTAATLGTVTLKAGTGIVCTFTDTDTHTAHCDVPALKGKSEAAAKKDLKRANCAVGKITVPKKAKKPKVSSTSPGAYAVRAAGSKVALKLKK